MSIDQPAIVVESIDWSVAFTVEGRPQPKERPRVLKGRTYTPERTAEYEARIAWAARGAMKGQAMRTEDGLRVFLIFDQADRRRSDIDNIVKAALDGLNGVIYRDDSQVTEVRAQLHRGAGFDRTTVMVAGPERAS